MSKPDSEMDVLSPQKSKGCFAIFIVIVLLLLVVTGIGGFAAWSYYDHTLKTAVNTTAQFQTFTIVQGESVKGIANKLEQDKLINNALLFRIAAKLQKKEAAIQAGDYEISASQTMQEIIDSLQHGEAKGIPITISPGWRIEEVAHYLANQHLVNEAEFLAAAKAANFDYTMLGSSNPFGKPKSASLEGYLIPDTYLVPNKPTVQDIMVRILNNFQDQYDQHVKELMSTSKLSLFEVLTLASIVEKEASKSDDRKMVAGIYLNRLNYGMALGADPTVAYALGSWSAPLTTDSLKINSPYNTRVNPGLPPGPIDSPSLSSILAVLEPTSSNYFYFLADRNGIMRYAKTLAEHTANKAKYGLSGE